MRTIIALILLTLVVVACGDDAGDGSESQGTQLTAEEREWCSFEDGSEASALRFDLIFEAGLGLRLPMDAMNAQAAGALDEFIGEGLSFDEATRRVSALLLEEETFVMACKQAYFEELGG
jgi:hypothetical protein